MHSSAMAFIAVRSDGSLASWGDFSSLRDSLFARELRGVKQVQASDEAFAAILSDGSVVSWGQFRSGGDSTAVQMQLQDARELHATRTAFAALLGNGSVVTWGHADGGGDSSAVQGQLRDVQELRATASAFVAFLLDGSAIVSGASLVMCVYVAVCIIEVYLHHGKNRVFFATQPLNPKPCIIHGSRRKQKVWGGGDCEEALQEMFRADLC